MKTDEHLQQEIQETLQKQPELSAPEIGVSVINGFVTLTGLVDSFSKKSEIENTVKKISGVKAIIEKIEVKFNDFNKREDIEIANEIVNSFNWSLDIPNDKLHIRLEDGWVNLEGKLLWNYQNEVALKAIKNMNGVKGVTNYVTLIPDPENR